MITLCDGEAPVSCIHHSYKRDGRNVGKEGKRHRDLVIYRYNYTITILVIVTHYSKVADLLQAQTSGDREGREEWGLCI